MTTLQRLWGRLNAVFNKESGGILAAEMSTYAFALDSSIAGIPGQLQQLISASEQLYLHTASSQWLDIWCRDYFGIPRYPDESDSDFMSRVRAEVLSVKSNNFAIEMSVQQATGVILQIIDKGDSSDKSGAARKSFKARIQSYEYWSSLSQSQKDRVRETILRVKAAGSVFSSWEVPASGVNDNITFIMSSALSSGDNGTPVSDCSPATKKYGISPGTSGWQEVPT